MSTGGFGQRVAAADPDLELAFSHPLEELVRSLDQRLMRPHMMHYHRICDEHTLGQIEDVDRRHRLHERSIADEHAGAEELGERIAECLRARAVINQAEALARASLM